MGYGAELYRRITGIEYDTKLYRLIIKVGKVSLPHRLFK